MISFDDSGPRKAKGKKSDEEGLRRKSAASIVEIM
jgi:hypothetical protein